MMNGIHIDIPLFLYRGISVETLKEVYGFYYLVDNRPVIQPLTVLNDGENFKKDYWLVIPETVSIYTGVDDVNDNPIFTNDILESFSISCVYQQVGDYPPPNVEVEEWEVERSVAEVNFKYGAFCADNNPIELDRLFDDMYDCDGIEINDPEGKRHFEIEWNDNTDNIQEKYPYLTWDHFQKPHIIGHTYDSFLEKYFSKNSDK